MMTARIAAIGRMAGLSVGVVASVAAATTIMLFPLAQMVADSTEIIVGRVEDIVRVCGPCPEPNQVDSFKAMVRVHEVLKGSPAEKVVIYFSSLGPSARFTVGQDAILLLRPWRDGYTTVQGYGGKLDVVEGVVPRMYALDEAENQSVEAVLRNIRREVGQ